MAEKVPHQSRLTPGNSIYMCTRDNKNVQNVATLGLRKDELLPAVVLMYLSYLRNRKEKPKIL